MQSSAKESSGHHKPNGQTLRSTSSHIPLSGSVSSSSGGAISRRPPGTAVIVPVQKKNPPLVSIYYLDTMCLYRVQHRLRRHTNKTHDCIS